MLIESAKDSLSFSVTHYKHPKQPHTVQVRHLFTPASSVLVHLCLHLRPPGCFQAKTVEERKLWAHHIKRIILENHHAIIPQKVRLPSHLCTHLNTPEAESAANPHLDCGRSQREHTHTHTKGDGSLTPPSFLSCPSSCVSRVFQAKDAIMDMKPTCESLDFLCVLLTC